MEESSPAATFDENSTSAVTDTLDQSTDSTQSSTPVASERRWNLRTRKPKKPVPEEKEKEEKEGAEDDYEGEGDDDEEDDDDEYDEEEVEEVVVKEKRGRRSNIKEQDSTPPPPPPPPPASSRKRKAPVIKAPSSKRKAVAPSPTTTSSKAATTTATTSKAAATTASKAIANTSRARADTSKNRGIYDAITSGKSSIKTVASDWVKRYEQDAESAMLELIRFFVLCCGCRAQVTMEMFRGETIDVIRTLTENFAEDSGDYPLIMSGPGQKKFKLSFTSFITLVIEQCQNSIVYDEYMLDTIIMWLVGFTDSQVRAFRHTCTLACLKLLSVLITLANNVNHVLDSTQRQVEAERKRQLVKRTGAGQAQLEKLVAKRGSLQQNKNELEDIMKGLFSSVFVHRYRDVRPEIRAVCITELGNWLLNYSVKFLADNYLKYVGWMLYDKVGEVRVASLKVLEAIYSSNDHAPHLELFTARFKERLLSLRLDVDDHAAVTAINVLNHMLSLELLDAEECVEVCELVFMESRAISHAAGIFTADYLFSEDFMERAHQKPVPAGKKKPSDGEIQLMELVRFFCEVRIHDHAHYFVDSLWESCEVLHDWEAMGQLLLDDKSSFSQLGDEEVKALIEIMTCAVRRAAGGTPPAGRAKGKFVASKDKKGLREDMTTHLMTLLPQLITRYGNDSSNATNLVSISQYFDLELYAEHRLQKHLENLLTHLHQLTVKHVEANVLDECAQTFNYLLDQEFSLYSTVEVSFRRLIDLLVESFKQYLTELPDQSMVDEEAEENFNLMVSIKRLASFYKLRNISGSKFTPELNTILGKGVDGECSEEMIKNVVVCLKLEVMWGVHELEESSSPSRDAMREVHLKMLQLFKHCEQLVKLGKGTSGQREAYIMFTDLLVVFARQLRKNPQLASLVYTPEPSLQHTLQDYVLDYVMNSMEDEDIEPATDEEALVMAEKLNDRRVLLAAYLKLIMYQVIDTKMAASIWAYLISQFHNFGDLIKVVMNKCRESNPIGWYKSIVACLTELYLQLKEEGGGESPDTTSERWLELRELAKKFALSLGFDAIKVRQPLVGIHREGILFAMSRQNMNRKEEEEVDHTQPPPHLNFLLILAEFSYRLLVVDRCGERGVLPFLMKQLPEGHFQRIREEGLEGWEALQAYFRVTQPNKGGVTSAAGGKGKKRSLKGGDGGISLRKAPRVEATPTESEVGSEEGGSERGSLSPPPVSETRKTRGRGQRVA